MICPEEAITEIPDALGVLEGGPAIETIYFAHGILNIGEPMAVPVISQLKKWGQNPTSVVTIIDSPPGASCPVVESVHGADFVLLVTEPTPFGLHDLRQAHQLTKDLNAPAGVIINRIGVGDTGVEDYCCKTNLPILMQIPLERQIGTGIAQGKTLLEIKPEYEIKFQELFTKIQDLTSKKEEVS